MTAQTSNESILIRIIDRPATLAGQFVKMFNHEANDGQGDGEFTIDPREAKAFASVSEAVAFYRKQPICKLLRDDGLPNRPLTASTVEFVTLSRAIAQESENAEHS